MHVSGRLTTCSQCGGVLWHESERLEPTSALLIGLMTCLRCGAAFLYATWPDGRAKREVDNDED